jgi:uncharacterized RDD family membrane protein YckC
MPPSTYGGPPPTYGGPPDPSTAGYGVPGYAAPWPGSSSYGAGPPLGWYPDPAGFGGHRWWDGRAWTPSTTLFGLSVTGPYITDPWGRVHVLSGWWRRALGIILDGLILAVPDALLAVVLVAHVQFVSISNGEVTSSSTTWWTLAVGVMAAIIEVAYATLLIGWQGQTVGMMAAGIRAVDGQTAGLLGRHRSLHRALVAFALTDLAGLLATGLRGGTAAGLAVTLAGVLTFVGTVGRFVTYLWPLGSPRNQTLQDKAVGSVVVKTR